MTRNLSSSNEHIRHTSWNQDAPVKKWDQKSDRKLDRSVTWDGSKGTNFIDEIRRSSTVSSWGGNRRTEERSERKRSISPETDDELDRGRVKKVKKKWEDKKMSYNPFQVVQNIKDRNGQSHFNKDKYKRNSSASGMRDIHNTKDRDYRDKFNRNDNRGHNRSSDGRREQSHGWDHNYHRN